MLEPLEEDVSFLLIPSILRSLLGDVHLILVHFALKILKNELLSIVFVLQAAEFRLQVLDLMHGIDSILFHDLVLEQDVSIQDFILLSQFA